MSASDVYCLGFIVFAMLVFLAWVGFMTLYYLLLDIRDTVKRKDKP